MTIKIFKFYRKMIIKMNGLKFYRKMTIKMYRLIEKSPFKGLDYIEK